MGQNDGYGNCTLCGYVGSVQYHHIIPKRIKFKDVPNETILFGSVNGKNNAKRYQKMNIKATDVTIPLCLKCHERIHVENYLFMKFLAQKIEKNDKLKNDKLEQSSNSGEVR